MAEQPLIDFVFFDCFKNKRRIQAERERGAIINRSGI